jgi:hypothetical protein
VNGDAELLHALAVALEAEGWSTTLITLDGPVRLRVVESSVPGFGETVSVMPHRSGPWFRSSTGAPMAACSDIPGAAAYVDRELDALVRPRVSV